MIYSWLGENFVPSIIVYGLSFIVLLIGSITDLKTREVPDWVNYGLIFAGLGLNLIFTSVYGNPSYIINSIIGLSIFFGIAYIMFYAGQWGGGDSKMLMGLGSIIGIDLSFTKPQFLAGFFINVLFAGAVYGLFWTVFLVVKNKQKFAKEFKKIILNENVRKAKKILIVILVIFLAAVFYVNPYYMKILLLAVLFMILSTFYLWVFVRAAEKTSMYKLIEPTKLTEGDWIVKDIYNGKEYLAGPKDLGIEKKQIKRLIELYKKGKTKKVLIKEGIPFVPSFFIAFIITLFYGNLLWVFF